MIFFDNLNFPRAKELELDNQVDRGTIPGYTLECTDGHTYLIFAPDMDSAKHMHAYFRLFRMGKKRMSDHMYDPVRLCFSPAWSNEIDEFGHHKVFTAPVSEMGKIYLVE